MEEARPRFDLHLHSYYSDGRLSPDQLIRKCRELGLEVIALTDHESVRGIWHLQAADFKDIQVIPGIEFATDYLAKEEHILGYFIDYADPRLDSFLHRWRKTKVSQIEAIVKNLQAMGFIVTMEEVITQTHDFIDRSHVLWAIFQNPENRAIILEYGFNQPRELFKKLLRDDAPAYVEREKPQLETVLNLIGKLQGISVWAHPFWNRNKYTVTEVAEKAAALQKLGLDGLEVCYAFYTEEQALALHCLAKKLGMFESAGSDFHSETMTTNQVAGFQTHGIEINFPFHGLRQGTRNNG